MKKKIIGVFSICIALALSTSNVNAQRNISTINNDGAKGAMEVSVIDSEPQEALKVVETMPEFPGGEKALMNFLSTNIKYPEEAREKGIEGKAFVEFIVEADGKISNVKVIKDPGAGLGQEAARVIKSMPRWKPGKQKGENVSVFYTLPITFKLQ